MQQLENDLDEAQENLLAANAKLEEKDKALQNVSDSTWLILSHLSFYHDTVLDKLLDFFLTQYLRLFDYYSIIRSVLVWYATWTRRRENANLIERWFSNLRFSRFSRRNTAIVIERKSSTLVLIFFFCCRVIKHRAWYGYRGPASAFTLIHYFYLGLFEKPNVHQSAYFESAYFMIHGLGCALVAAKLKWNLRNPQEYEFPIVNFANDIHIILIIWFIRMD